jgi:hypothetical protein
MIDIKKALKQNCYIVFDNTEQLKQFVEAYNIHTFMGVDEGSTIMYCPESKDGDYVTIRKKLDISLLTYHHTELTTTDNEE